MFSIVTIVSCGQTTSNNKTDRKEVLAAVHPVDTSLIAIIPFDNSMEWLFGKTHTPSTLTQGDVEKIERLLTALCERLQQRNFC